MVFLAERRPTASLVGRRGDLVYTGEQIGRTARTIEASGFNAPILLDKEGAILAGYAQYAAAKAAGLPEVPCVFLEQMTEATRRAYIVAEYKLALEAGWDEALLARELDALFEGSILSGGEYLHSVGIHPAVPRRLLVTGKKLGREDALPPPEDHLVTRRGDLWLLGAHRLLCDDASDPVAYSHLMGQERSRMVFVDPLSSAAERSWGATELSSIFALLAAHTLQGGTSLVCSDWRHMRTIIEAGEAAFGGLADLVVWIRSEGATKGLYPGHELIFVFEKSGTSGEGASNEQGRRPRSDFWRWPALGDVHADTAGDLSLQLFVKPAALLVAAIEDCTEADDVVLDPVCGAGTTLIAAELTQRRVRALEGDPASCDRTIRRWQTFTGREAVLAGTGEVFEAVRHSRAGEAAEA